MFEGLKKKWNVNGWRLLLILVTFALGGSLTGYLGKKIMELLGLKVAGFAIILYVILVTIIWPLCVLIVSIPLGQFRFFLVYIRKLFARMRGRPARDQNENKVH
jgi:predicted neutral ceramidase superfamily lipid hydrolase